jgi:hypothetical protein
MVNPQPFRDSIMSLHEPKPGFQGPAPAGSTISPLQSLHYMGDLLENMRKMAQAQDLGVLAHLLELARVETRLITRDHGVGLRRISESGN